MNQLAYNAGCRAAFAKFGGASAAGPDGASSYRDMGSPVATTHHRDSAQNISQNFRYNASLSDPSAFTQPAHTNSTMQGGPPTKPFKSDTTGGLRDS
jgi:hypothetical protein